MTTATHPSLLPPQELRRRRRLVGISVGTAFLLIFIGWIATLKTRLSANENRSGLSEIRRTIGEMGGVLSKGFASMKPPFDSLNQP